MMRWLAALNLRFAFQCFIRVIDLRSDRAASPAFANLESDDGRTDVAQINSRGGASKHGGS